MEQKVLRINIIEQVRDTRDILEQQDMEKMAQMTLKGLEQNQKKVERIDIAAELWAAHTQNQELRNVIETLARKYESSRAQLDQANERAKKLDTLTIDQATLLGQTDIAIWGARELDIEKSLNPEFSRTLKNQNRSNRRGDETRFENNRLLHHNIDDLVKRRSKETKVRTLLFSTRGNTLLQLSGVLVNRGRNKKSKTGAPFSRKEYDR